VPDARSREADGPTSLPPATGRVHLAGGLGWRLCVTGWAVYSSRSTLPGLARDFWVRAAPALGAILGWPFRDGPAFPFLGFGGIQITPALRTENPTLLGRPHPHAPPPSQNCDFYKSRSFYFNHSSRRSSPLARPGLGPLACYCQPCSPVFRLGIAFRRGHQKTSRPTKKGGHSLVMRKSARRQKKHRRGCF